MTVSDKTFIAMILDRSGSMADCRTEAVTAVNAYLDEARKGDLKEADFELVIFDTQSIDTIRSGPMSTIADITDAEFEPRYGTPLYDAVGRGIKNLEAKLAVANSQKAILVIVTDGEENSSLKYTHAQITELIKAKQAAGWMVLFLAAGLDAARAGLRMGVHAGSTAAIGKSASKLAATMSFAAGRSATYAMAGTASAHGYARSQSFTPAERKLMGDDDEGKSLQPDEDSLITSVFTPIGHAAQSVVADAFEKADKDAWGSGA